MEQGHPRYGGYSPKLILHPKDIPRKYICTFCSKVVKSAFQLPHAIDPKIVCASCYDWNFM